MSQTFEFYDERAKAAEAEAERALLDNVRERELRSAKAWREMANRQLLIDAERVKSEEIRAKRRAAVFGSDEAITLVGVEEFDCADGHDVVLARTLWFPGRNVRREGRA